MIAIIIIFFFFFCFKIKLQKYPIFLNSGFKNIQFANWLASTTLRKKQFNFFEVYGTEKNDDDIVRGGRQDSARWGRCARGEYSVSYCLDIILVGGNALERYDKV